MFAAKSQLPGERPVWAAQLSFHFWGLRGPQAGSRGPCHAALLAVALLAQ